MTDGILPAPVAALLDVALVSELTVIDGDGRPVTYLDSSATSQTPDPVIEAMPS